MPNCDSVTLFKFPISGQADSSYMASIGGVQKLAKEAGQLAQEAGCETLRLFNYVFSFGSKAAIDDVNHRLRSICATKLYRVCEMFLDESVDYEQNKPYICWLLAVADRSISESIALTSFDNDRAFSLTQWLSLLEKSPVVSLIDATFVPTLNVNSPGHGIRPRFPDGLNVANLQRALEPNEAFGRGLLLLDGDGIKKAQPNARRPTIFAMHEQRVRDVMKKSESFDNKMKHIYSSRLELDGLFDAVVSLVVGKIIALGHVAQYLGGDELVAIAPVDVVADAVESACSTAPFEIAFSCGKCEMSAFDQLEEGFALAKEKLLLAKLLNKRQSFNIVE